MTAQTPIAAVAAYTALARRHGVTLIDTQPDATGTGHIQAVLTRRPPSVADVLAMYPREGEG